MLSHPRTILDSLGIHSGAIVGDFGTGEGAYARECVERVGETGAVYAFDVQKQFVTRLAREAEERGLRTLKALWVDLETPRGTGLADGTLDTALVANVLFQIEHKEIFLAEVRRVLRANGRMLLVDWSERVGAIGPHADQLVPLARARALAESAGFVFDKELPAGAHHYGLLFHKK